MGTFQRKGCSLGKYPKNLGISTFTHCSIRRSPKTQSHEDNHKLRFYVTCKLAKDAGKPEFWYILAAVGGSIDAAATAAAAFVVFLLGIHAPSRHVMPHTQNSGHPLFPLQKAYFLLSCVVSVLARSMPRLQVAKVIRSLLMFRQLPFNTSGSRFKILCSVK